MYMLYIDESGDIRSWEHDHFVIAGIAVHEGQVTRLSRKLDDIQKEFFPYQQIPLAFHATDLHAGRGQFASLSPEKRSALETSIYSCISSEHYPFLVAFATATHVSHASTQTQVLYDTFQDVLSRFHVLLGRQFQHDQPNKGLLIIDQAHKEDYRELIANFRHEGTRWQGVLEHIIDIPYFAGRRDTRMLQLADFCAYAVFRYYVYHDRSCFDHVLPRIDRRGPQNPPDGLKHYTRLPCQCEACSWRQ